jgi:hypothetical protein
MTASYLTRTREHTPANSAKKVLRKAKAVPDLSCRACDAKNIGLAMDPRYYHHRSSSPGARKLVIPGRSSTGTVGSNYIEPLSASGHSRSPRDDYLSISPRTGAERSGGGVIPISTEVYANYAPPSATAASGTRDPYSGRPRRSTLEGAEAPSGLRSRSAIVQHNATIVRPSSPLSRYEPRDAYVKTAGTPARREHKKTMYSVDNGSAKMIAETETAPRGREYRDSYKDRGSYHASSGSSNRPREVDEGMFSYTDAAGMYRDTEPRWRPRRGSVDRGSRRPSSVIEPFGPSTRVARDMGPPPTTRGFQKLNSDLGRTSSVRDPVRASSRDRSGTYDSYGNGANYDMPIRSSSTMPIVVAQPRGDRYYDDSSDNERDPRRRSRIVDEAVETRGFGIRRSSSADRYAPPPTTDLPKSFPPPPPRANPPPAIYSLANEPLVPMPTTQDYIPRSVDDERRSSAVPPPPREYTSRGIDDDRRGSALPPSKDYLTRPIEDHRRASDVPVPANYLSRPAEDHRRASEIPPPPKDYLVRPAEDIRRGSDVPPPKDYLPRAPEDSRRGSDDRRERDRAAPSGRDYLPRATEDDRRGSEDRRDRDRDRDRERDYDRHRERDLDRPRERDRDSYREKPRSEHESRGSVVIPTAAAAAGAVAAGAALNKHSRDKKYESDEDRERARRSSRPEPNAAEDDREHRYAERDRLREEEKKRERGTKKEDIDPDEEYRRRVQQQAEELSQVSRQRSREEERSDSDRERRRRERLGRDERERRERRRDSSDDDIGPKEMPRRERKHDSRDEGVASKEPSRPTRDLDLEEQTSRQHGRYDQRSNSILDNGFVDEPDAIDTRGRALPPPITTTGPHPETASRDAPPSGQAERRVTIVEPPKKEPSPEPRVKSILRKPTEKFPEHPNPIREGVAPLKEKLEKDKRAKDIPSGAKWTKIDRKLVNPQSLEEKGERFEERMDCVIVLRVLTKQEIQEFADRTREIRGTFCHSTANHIITNSPRR